jgi:NAD(P)H-dependent glutamate synthase small subunit
VAKTTGFLEYAKETLSKRPVEERLRDFAEIEQLMDSGKIEVQAARCMDCGIPFCHSFGCPLKNRIPDLNDLLYHKQWKKAVALLHVSNNFPEITGRICPALCEEACTLAVNKEPVSIRLLELHLVEKGWKEGWIIPEPPVYRTRKQAAVIGSGPAGLAAAQQLRRMGHEVVVIESAEKPGGLLRYGIPDFKLSKSIIDRRLAQMREEGVVFETGVVAGEDMSVKYLKRTFDAILIAAGSREPRDIKIPGRELRGIHFALDFLTGQNRRLNNESIPGDQDISAKGRNVVVVGGGDTGADCIGTARRQGAKDIVQIELLPEPPKDREADNPWPTWPLILRNSSSHEEGCTRLWSILTQAFEGENGAVKKLHCVKLDWYNAGKGKKAFREVPGSEFVLEADLVLLATGFVHVRHDRLVRELKIRLDPSGNLEIHPDQMTSETGVFAAGDCVRGASLAVHAISAGRQAAEMVSRWLK